MPVRSPVGHSIIKPIMRDQNIPFGGEHSGHFYFRDNWFADSGMIALMQCLEIFSEAGEPVSETIGRYDTRFRSGGKLNSVVVRTLRRRCARLRRLLRGRRDRLPTTG